MSPTRVFTAGASASMKIPGRTPTIRQSAAKTNIAASENRSVSWALVAAAVRARPRKVTPKALTKQAAASAADNASSAPTPGTRNFNPQDGSCGLSRMAWNISHSETKPLSGGSAEMAAQPTRNATAVCGMRWMRPPRCSMSRSPVAVSTAPAPKNSRLLNTEWLSTCSSPAVSASAAAQAMPCALKASASPSPMKMIPMFSTV